MSGRNGTPIDFEGFLQSQVAEKRDLNSDVHHRWLFLAICWIRFQFANAVLFQLLLSIAVQKTFWNFSGEHIGSPTQNIILKATFHFTKF
jgi:hypothetical protein